MKKKYPVIGLTGAAGSGKDTVADILRETHRFIKLGFADPLYDMMSIVTRMPVESLRRREGKEVVIGRVGASPRTLGQTLGTEWGRNMIAEDLWIRHLDGRLRDIELRTGLNGLIISDVRFQNEIDYVHSLGGEVWRIERPDNPFAVVSEHPSEKPALGVDDLIVNNLPLEGLKKVVLSKYVEYLGV